MAAEGEFLSADKASKFAESIYGWQVSGQTLKSYMKHGRIPRGRKEPVCLQHRTNPVNGYMQTTVAWMKEHASRFPPLQ